MWTKGPQGHLAASLVTLINQIDQKFPERSKASDGSIGDSAHQSSVSDHNPWFNRTVTAIDITHDPKAGLNILDLAESLVRSRDPRIKYIIRNRQIINSKTWIWQEYTGSNPHDKHLHISVMNNLSCDSEKLWNLDILNESRKADMANIPQWQWDRLFDRVLRLSAGVPGQNHSGEQYVAEQEKINEILKRLDKIEEELKIKP